MHTTDKVQDDANLFSSSIYRSTSPLPVTLSIYSESRYKTLKHYKPSFVAYQKQPQVYFNHQIDTQYLRDIDILWFIEFLLMFPHGDITRTRHLVLTELYFVGCTNRIKRLSIGINNWILTKDLSTNK
jgi:hypothetical protein